MVELPARSGRPTHLSLSDTVARRHSGRRREELAVATCEPTICSRRWAVSTASSSPSVSGWPTIPSPRPIAWRPAQRIGREGGAPLYACCEFADNVPEAERAGLEAAIEGAGLLDAWVGEGV